MLRAAVVRAKEMRDDLLEKLKAHIKDLNKMAKVRMKALMTDEIVNK